MRSPARAAAILGTALAVLCTLGNAAAAPADPASKATSDADPTTKDVSYAGTTVTVPADWPVYDLTAEPHRCVRFDRHAVYLGHPGTEQRCPSHLVGRTTALLIEPYDRTARGHVEPSTDGTVQRLSASRTALITTTYGSEGATAATAALKATPLAAAAPQALETAPDRAGSTGTADADAVPRRTTFAGLGFDTCAAPSLRAMKAWSRSSPYRAVGIYVGGISRACGLGNLDHAWVQEVRGYGFHFIPTYVGRQAPCTGFSARISRNEKVAHSQGTWAAQDAVRAMKALGFGPGSPVYIDIEQYDGGAACSSAVVQFVAGWSAELHRDGFVSGYYSSQLKDMIAKRYITHPDAVWIARWNDRPGVYGIDGISNKLWDRHRRLHQYEGPHNARFGGFTLNIDSDGLDGPVG